MSAHDLRADTLRGEDLEDDGVVEAPVDDMRLARALLERGQAGLDLRDHAALDDARLDVVARLLHVKRREERGLVGKVLVDALDVRQ